jgi:hypothetical protein
MHKETWCLAFGTLTFLALAHCGGFTGSGDDAPADGGSDGPDGATPPDAGRCSITAYGGQEVTGGVLCGVGSCRVVASGDTCTVKGPIESFCQSLFPSESFDEAAGEKDDNCDGRVNEGRPVESSAAGVRCTGCGVGRSLKRRADGSFEEAGERQFAECVNSVLCPAFPGSGWVANPKKERCKDFCDAFAFGATCTQQCSTSIANGCSGDGIKTGNIGSYSKGSGCTTGTCEDSAEFCCCKF